MDSLQQARKRISEADAKIAELFCTRMKAAEQVGLYKKQHGLGIVDSAREKELIQHNAALIEDQTIREYYVRFLEQTIALSRDYQQRLMSGAKIAYSGTQGAFAHLATEKLFPTAQKIAYPDFVSAYRAVQNGECDTAVLPVENSFHGEVGQVTDLMFDGSLYVNSMIELAVSQDLLVVPGATAQDVREVVSHPQALGQCAAYIQQKGYITHEYTNTALAAKYVAQRQDKSVAAIASAQAAQLFGLCVLEKNINESANNTTKFAVFSRADNRYGAQEKGVHTILMFTVRNEAGALAKAVNIIGKYNFNMISLRSRNQKQLLWQYYFYAELEGNIHTQGAKEMLEELALYCDQVKIAGTFKKENVL